MTESLLFAILNSEMIKKIICLFFFIFFTGTLSCFAHPFYEGERLSYVIKLMGIPVGTQVLKVEDVIQEGEKSLYLLTSMVKTSGIASIFFDMDDRVESIVDSETFYPRFVRIKIKENSRREEIEAKIKENRENIKAFLWDKRRGKKWEEELSSSPLDILSLVYWIRAQKLEVGKKFEVLLLDIPGKFEPINFEVVREDKAYTYLGVFPALVCEQKNVKGRIRVWFSRDERHLPLYIQVDTSLGYLTAILRKVD